MLCLMLQVYLNHGDSWDTASKEGLHSLLPAVWGWFCAIEAVLTDKVDQSWLELLYRINGTCRGRGRECEEGEGGSNKDRGTYVESNRYHGVSNESHRRWLCSGVEREDAIDASCYKHCRERQAPRWSSYCKMCTASRCSNCSQNITWNLLQDAIQSRWCSTHTCLSLKDPSKQPGEFLRERRGEVRMWREGRGE